MVIHGDHDITTSPRAQRGQPRSGATARAMISCVMRRSRCPGDRRQPRVVHHHPLPDLGRRLGAVGAARARPDARRQAGGDPPTAGFRRDHRRDEHGAEASFRDQGRTARRGRLSGARGDAAHLRRSRRRPRHDRFRADGRRPDDLRRRPRDHRGAPDRGAAGGRRSICEAADETPKPGDPRLANATTTIIASPMASLEAAATLARAAGVTPLILGDAIEGEAREVGRAMAADALRQDAGGRRC